MWQQLLKRLFLDTIYAPRAAARQLLDLQLPSNAIWLSLALATVLNTLAFSATLLAFPPVAPPVLLSISPFVIASIYFASIVTGAGTLHWAGKAVGGTAGFQEFLILVTWLQFMRFAVQLAGIVLMLFLPGLASILTFLAMLYGIWILVNFINEAQGYDSLGKSTANLLLGFLGLMIVLSLIISVVGLGVYEIS